MVSKEIKYRNNYDYNSSKTQPYNYVYGQNAYSDWKFGSSNMSYAGCEVIAGYNLAYALGRDYTLADTIFLYESLGIEIGLAQGYFGSNPYQISYFLESIGISYTKILSYKTFKTYMDNNKDYYIILSRWNGESADSMIHTFMIDKDFSNDYKFEAYNCDIDAENEKSKYIMKTSDYSKYFGARISKTYICAYFIEK